MSGETPPQRITPDHPPYALMVRCAIESLGEPNGSTVFSISTFIQSNYHSLPWAHSKLLPYYLNKLITAGEISASEPSSYPRRFTLPNPTPNSNLRGRGRPPKLATSPTFQNPNPNILHEEMREKPRLIVRLKRREGEGDNCGGWVCLKDADEEDDIVQVMQVVVVDEEEVCESRESRIDQESELPMQVETAAAAVEKVEEEENQENEKVEKVEEENKERKKVKKNKTKRLWYER